MKKLLIIVAMLCVVVGVAYSRPWTASCVFGTDNTCIVDLGAVGVNPGNGNAAVFVPAGTSRSGVTLTLSTSLDNTTYYTTYTENGDTAVDTFPGDNTANKSFGMSTVFGGRYWKFTASDNTFNGATLYIHGRD